MPFWIYIITNEFKTVLYTGVTNHLVRRMIEHHEQRGNRSSFSGRYRCSHLVYFEAFEEIERAIRREKEIKGWNRKKKLRLIQAKNPDMVFLNPMDYV